MGEDLNALAPLFFDSLDNVAKDVNSPDHRERRRKKEKKKKKGKNKN
jgi:hypothetical protein